MPFGGRYSIFQDLCPDEYNMYFRLMDHELGSIHDSFEGKATLESGIEPAILKELLCMLPSTGA